MSECCCLAAEKSFAYTRICYQKMVKERNVQVVPLAMNENDLSTPSNKKSEMKNVKYLPIFEPFYRKFYLFIVNMLDAQNIRRTLR